VPKMAFFGSQYILHNIINFLHELTYIFWVETLVSAKIFTQFYHWPLECFSRILFAGIKNFGRGVKTKIVNLKVFSKHNSQQCFLSQGNLAVY
jgi:hypothetical protein